TGAVPQADRALGRIFLPLERFPMVVLSQNPKPEGARRRRISPEKLRANRANGRRSKGATSVRGRAIAARNHTTHGMRCSCTPGQEDLTFLPTESKADFDADVERSCREQGAGTALEIEQIRIAIYQVWVRRRIERATGAAANDRIAKLQRAFAARTADDARELLA